jgi:hypothetical protein
VSRDLGRVALAADRSRTLARSPDEPPRRGDRLGASGVAVALVAAVAVACSSAPRRDPSAVAQARLLLASGDEARAVGDPAGAARAYARALSSARAGDDRALAADLGYRLGVALLAAGDAREAAVQLEDSARTAASVGEPRLAARALLALGRARQDAGAGDAAVAEALGRALLAGRQARDPAAEALAHVGLAAVAEEAEAGSHLDEAARLAGEWPAVAAPLALNRARRAEKAADAGAGGLYRQAAERYRLLEDAAGLHEALAGAARAADREGDPREAAGLHRRAADAAVRSGAMEAAVAELRLSADAHRKAGDASGAARREAEAARLAREGARGP